MKQIIPVDEADIYVPVTVVGTPAGIDVGDKPVTEPEFGVTVILPGVPLLLVILNVSL